MIVDARGLRCPLPIIRLAAAARIAPPGTEITVLWTDPAARHDIPAWARMRGHAMVTGREEEPAGDDDAPAWSTTVLVGPGA